MATELNTRSKGYSLTRFACSRSVGNVAVQVSTAWNRPFISLTTQEIEGGFASGDWSALDVLELLEETVERLTLDLAQFALTKGKGMEKPY